MMQQSGNPSKYDSDDPSFSNLREPVIQSLIQTRHEHADRELAANRQFGS
jgi:hypothetical protein